MRRDGKKLSTPQTQSQMFAEAPCLHPSPLSPAVPGAAPWHVPAHHDEQPRKEDAVLGPHPHQTPPQPLGPQHQRQRLPFRGGHLRWLQPGDAPPRQAQRGASQLAKPAPVGAQ